MTTSKEEGLSITREKIDPQKAIDFFYFVLGEFRKNSFAGKKTVFEDIQPYADKYGIDLRACMELIREVVENNSYNCGFHFRCTEMNVLPDYDKKGCLVEHQDHIGGLAKILQVHIGQIQDY
jgi:hypothetical protein